MTRKQNVFLIPIVTLVVGFAGGLITGAAVAPKSETTHVAVSAPKPEQDDKDVQVFLNVSRKIADEIEKLSNDAGYERINLATFSRTFSQIKESFSELKQHQSEQNLFSAYFNLQNAIEQLTIAQSAWYSAGDDKHDANVKKTYAVGMAKACIAAIDRVSLFRKDIDEFTSHLP